MSTRDPDRTVGPTARRITLYALLMLGAFLIGLIPMWVVARGRAAERYILGNAEGNWTLQQALNTLQEITGIPAPKMRVPYGVAYAAAVVDESISKITGRPPKAPIAGVRMAKYKMFFNPAKAIRELGMPQTPPKQALADAVEWFRKHGYA